jgi:hypothetical protein
MTLKQEWWMLTKICWFPFSLFCIFPVLINYLQFDIELNRDLLIVTITILKAVISSVIIVGVYRYLLSDSRFHIRTIPFRRNSEALPMITISIYLLIDKFVIILAVFFVVLQVLLSPAHFFVFKLIDRSTFYIETVSSIKVAEYVWKVILLSIASQLFLIFPYIATSQNITWRAIKQNVKALNGNRIRVFIIQAFIIGCFMTAMSLVNLSFGLFYDSRLPIHYYSKNLIYAVIWLIMLLTMTIFSTTIFKIISAKENITHN